MAFEISLSNNLKIQVMKKNNRKSAAVQLMLSATLEEYLMYIQNLTVKVN